MDTSIKIPRELLVRLMAAIETPDDLTEEEISDLLLDANTILDDIGPLRAITVTLLARDEDEAKALFNEISGSEVVSDWPCFGLDEREATPEEEAWLRDEYDSEVEIPGAGITRGELRSFADEHSDTRRSEIQED